MRITVACLLILLSLRLSAQTFDKAKMDSLFALIEENKEGMGSISIFENGKEVYQNTIGYEDLEKEDKASANTKYRIGSISKTFTAAIIMQLIEEGKLSQETPLAKFYPKISNADSITIEHLLRHRSGLFNFTSGEDYTSWMESSQTEEELIRRFENQEPQFAPGEKTEYSNTNYVLLSLIAEKVDKKSYDEILRKRITKPLGLENTYYGGKIDALKDEALSYSGYGNWKLATETDMTVPRGAGGIVSTPTDLNVFYTALFNGKVVDKQSLEKMKSSVDGFGIGLFPIPFYDRQAYGHTGGIDGFRSNAGYFPDEKVSIAYLSNAESMPVNDVMIGALSIYFGKEYEMPTFNPAMKVSSEELEKYLGTYSSPTFPLKLTITKDGDQLIGQATGQPTFPLKAYEKDKFEFDPAKLKIHFNPDSKSLILLQGGGQFELTKE